MVALTKILEWFKAGLEPTESQFHDTWTSFWHKSERLPQTQVLGLNDALNDKADKSVVSALTNGIIKQPSVDTYNDTSDGETSLLNTYPNPKVGWDVLVREENTRYNWNGSEWVNMETGVYDEEILNRVDNIDGMLNPAYLNHWNFFNGSSSETVLDKTYILSRNGDYIEFDFILYDNGNTYPNLGLFGTRNDQFNTIGVLSLRPVLRDKDGNWVIPSSGTTFKFSFGQKYTVKFSYENDDTVCYVNDEIKRRSSGVQGIVNINNIGYAYTQHANFHIRNIKINSDGQLFQLANLQEFGKVTDVTLQDLDNLGLLTSDQENRLLPVGASYSALENKVALLMQGKTLYSSYNGIDAETVLSSTYSIDKVGDYFEIMCRFPNYTYLRDLAFLGVKGITSNFFAYRRASGYNCFTIRDNGLNWNNFLNPQTIGYWHVIRVDVVNEGWQLSVDGIVDSVIPKTDPLYIDNIGQAYSNQFCEYDIQYVKINSKDVGYFENYDLSNYSGSKNVVYKVENGTSPDQIISYPACVVDYKKTGAAGGRQRFTVYVQYPNTDKYQGYIIDNNYSDVPSFYQNLFRIISADIYQYKEGNFISTGVRTLDTGESEFVLNHQGAGKVDHTGGVHGDEQLVNVRFFVDGVLITDDELANDFKYTCNEFSYVQETTLHETAVKINKDTGLQANGSGVVTVNATTRMFEIDGISTNVIALSVNSYITAAELALVTLTVSPNNTWVLNNIIQPIDGHPVIAKHWKFTTFKDSGYITKNRVEWVAANIYNYTYCGIVCIARNNGKLVYDERYKFEETIDNGGHRLEVINSPLREIYYTNAETNMSAHVTSRFLNSDLDNASRRFVWDNGYVKYYRRNETVTPNVGDIWEMECKVRFYTNKL